MVRALSLCVSGLLLAGPIAALAVPPYVDDSTRALSPKARRELEQELSEFHAETGVMLTVKAISYLESGVTMRTAARQARLATSDTGPVALIMIERGKNGFGISHSPNLWQRYPLAEMVEVLRSALMAAAERELEVEDRLLATTREWMREVRLLEGKRNRGLVLISDREKPFVIGFSSLLALVGLGCLYFAAKAQVRIGLQNQRYQLPEVAVGQRLGAPFGGGRIILWQHERKPE